MSWKQRMHPMVSNAEMELFQALSQEGLTSGMVTQKPIVLRVTVPDFMWAEKRKVVYLDGKQVHGSYKAMVHDEEIDALLERGGWSVLRIPYDPPLTSKALAAILVEVKAFVGL